MPNCKKCRFGRMINGKIRCAYHTEPTIPDCGVFEDNLAFITKIYLEHNPAAQPQAKGEEKPLTAPPDATIPVSSSPNGIPSPSTPRE